MNKEKIKVYSLTTTYPESTNSTKPKFVHLLNRELVKLGINVKVIVPHSKGARTSETIDSVFVRRFRYLPEDYELDYTSIAEEVRKSKFGKLKIMIMTLNFLLFTIFECLKERPDIMHGHWGFPGGYIAFLVSAIFGSKLMVRESNQIGYSAIVMVFSLVTLIYLFGKAHGTIGLSFAVLIAIIINTIFLATIYLKKSDSK